MAETYPHCVCVSIGRRAFFLKKMGTFFFKKCDFAPQNATRVPLETWFEAFGHFSKQFFE